jgi:hypothetical protein
MKKIEIRADKAKNFLEKRAILIVMSEKARDLRKKNIDECMKKGDLNGALWWTSMRVNDIIAGWYREKTGANDFKTFAQWKSEGYSIRKGEHAFLLWGKKQTAERKNPDNDNDNDDNQIEGHQYRFFPVAYLFSDLQVIRKEQETKEVVQIAEIQEVTQIAETHEFILD